MLRSADIWCLGEYVGQMRITKAFVPENTVHETSLGLIVSEKEIFFFLYLWLLLQSESRSRSSHYALKAAVSKAFTEDGLNFRNTKQ